MTIREKIEHLQMARDAVFRAIYHLDAIGARKTSDELGEITSRLAELETLTNFELDMKEYWQEMGQPYEEDEE
jgi:hypothetical protein